jgi:hypothetical protein
MKFVSQQVERYTTELLRLLLVLYLDNKEVKY